MNNGGDAAEQIVRLSLEGVEVAAKLSGSAAKNIAILLASVLKQEASQVNKTRGKARLTNMIKSGKELKVFSISNKDLKTFTEQAKRYGVLYCVLRDKNTKGDNVPVDIIARAEDASKIQRIVERFDFNTVEKASVIAEAQKEKANRESMAKEMPTKSKNEIIMEEAVRKPMQKEGQSQSNPSVAKTDKNPPSRQNSEQVDMLSDKGVAGKETKPSVKEKLDRYKAKANQQKESERKTPEIDKPKSTTKNAQTVHTQPKPKVKKSKER
ncbi:MAG: PcfB family protein [Lachnospiraceae bacterium]|nr:PcfB family protein [Lachnospiraceae bacterium]